MASPAQSPYEVALGKGFGELHPRLRAYFAAIPTGMCGLGEGTFDPVGTPQRWLRIPRFLAPRIEIIERFSDADDRQHVEVALSVPLLGKVYEYAGSFRYEPRAEPE